MLEYLLWAAIGAVVGTVAAAAIITISLTVWVVLSIYNLASTLLQKNTNGATKAKVEGISSAISGAKVVEVGLFKGSERVGNATIRCENGTSLHYGETVYL
jgi:hypothetical protein